MPEPQPTVETLRIKAIGIGGAGINAVRHLHTKTEHTLSIAAINTDAKELEKIQLPEQLMIGRTLTRGLSSGGNAEIGKQAAEDEIDAISQMTKEIDLLFICVGLGGGTGSGAAPVVARTAATQGALVIAFATLPFNLEGQAKQQLAESTLRELRKLCHAVIPLPNELLLQHMPADTTVLEAFAKADAWIHRGISSIHSVLFQTGIINLDFGALKQLFCHKSDSALFAIGRGEGDNYVEAALEELTSCPLLHTTIATQKPDRLLVNIIGGRSLKLQQIQRAMQAITAQFGEPDHTALGAIIDESADQYIELCIIGVRNAQNRHYTHPGKINAKPEIGEEPPEASSTEEEVNLDKLELITASANHSAGSQKVHNSKLKRAKKAPVEQNQAEFIFISEDERRGYFEGTEKNLYEDEDLDVPTYIRKGIHLHL